MNDIEQKFYELAIKERDLERFRVDTLQIKLDDLRGKLEALQNERAKTTDHETCARAIEIMGREVSEHAHRVEELEAAGRALLACNHLWDDVCSSCWTDFRAVLSRAKPKEENELLESLSSPCRECEGTGEAWLPLNADTKGRFNCPACKGKGR
jgi:chromosome segregation ATPase